MSGEQENSTRISIFGSCVSRDTCEFMPRAEVVCYVARQSAIVSLSPTGRSTFSSEALPSAFQSKMFEGDQAADATARILDSDADLILIDLVDERRGVWEFPTGSYLTNSVEAYRTGIDTWAPRAGGRLIEFGTDEHFDLWKKGFAFATDALRTHSAKMVLLDVAWAEVFDGQELPRGLRSTAGTLLRKSHRGARKFQRALSRGDSIGHALGQITSPGHTKAEEFVLQARTANDRFARYSAFARSRVSRSVVRSVEEVRMNADHRWGAEPFHYRDSDYRNLVAELTAITATGTE